MLLNAKLLKSANFKEAFLVFYDNLKAECDRQNLKITSIVIECGGASGSINGWKKGAMPNSSIVIALSIRLNVSTDYLLLGKEDSNNISQSTDISNSGVINQSITNGDIHNSSVNQTTGNYNHIITKASNDRTAYSVLEEHLDSLSSSECRHAIADLMDLLELRYPKKK